MKVLVDDKTVSIERGTSLRRILAEAASPHKRGTIVALSAKNTKESSRGNRLAVRTTKGNIILDFDPLSIKADLIQKIIANLTTIQLADRNILSLGSLAIDEQAYYSMYELKAGEFLLDAAGMDRENVCLVVSKRNHKAFYSAIGGRVAGRLVSGKDILHNLDKTDEVIEVQKIAMYSTDLECVYHATDDLEQSITSEGRKVYSFVEVMLSDATPESGEILLHLLKDGRMKIDVATGSFVSTRGDRDIPIKEKVGNTRRRGAITIRNTGNDRGRIYAYTETRVGAEAHTVVGQVSRGIQLLDVAQAGDSISIVFEPKVINVLGLSQRLAEEYLADVGVEQIRSGDTDNSAIVVRQIPFQSVLIDKSGKIETIGLPASQLVRIRIYDQAAPKSAKLFRIACGMLFNPIGTLRVTYPYSPLIGAVLLSSKIPPVEMGRIEPENIPVDCVGPGDIGMTNSVKNRAGVIGIRIKESREFGPTCESLDSTNIVGRISEDSIQIIKEAMEGEEIHFTEVDRSRFSHPPA